MGMNMQQNQQSEQRHCAASVCDTCGHHNGLARCYCGWAADGGNGYEQLVAAGETIEPDPEDADPNEVYNWEERQ